MHKSILLIEDNPIDYEIFIRAFQKIAIDVEIIHCTAGKKALSYLLAGNSNPNVYNHHKPSLILLDLGLDYEDGKYTLQAIKENASLKSIPVIVLSNSTNPSDVQLCYQYGANCYLNKSFNFHELYKSLKRLLELFLYDAVPSPDL